MKFFQNAGFADQLADLKRENDERYETYVKKNDERYETYLKKNDERFDLHRKETHEFLELNVKRMEENLLKKVRDHRLYVDKLEEENVELQKQNAELQKAVAELKKAMNKMKGNAASLPEETDFDRDATRCRFDGNAIVAKCMIKLEVGRALGKPDFFIYLVQSKPKIDSSHNYLYSNIF
jgi:hypothetical protein